MMSFIQRREREFFKKWKIVKHFLIYKIQDGRYMVISFLPVNNVEKKKKNAKCIWFYIKFRLY